MQRLRSFLFAHKTLIISVGFLVLFSITVSYATPPSSAYNPGETLDPACAPGTTNCTVTAAGGSSPWTVTGNDIYYNTGKVGIGTTTPGAPLSIQRAAANTPLALFTDGAGIELMRIASDNGTNVFMGNQAGASNTATSATAGEQNTFVGSQAGFSNTTGYNNTGLGYQALYSTTTSTAFSNVAVGTRALYLNTTGKSNTGVGAYVMGANTIGDFNTAVGNNSLRRNTTGASNTAVGYDSLWTSVDGFNNSAFGIGALMLTTSGHSNNAFGHYALSNNTLGHYNSAFGTNTFMANTTGSFNIGIGSYVEVPDGTASGQLNIGNVLYGTGLYQTASASFAPTGGMLGINTVVPTATLDITGTLKTSGVNTFSNLAGSGNRLIQVDSNGVATATLDPSTIGQWTNVTGGISYSNGATAQTATARVISVSNAGATFNTASGALSSYGGHFASTATRSAGSNALTNIGLYATASGAQNNYAAIFDQGNVGIGTTAPGSLLTIGTVNPTVSLKQATTGQEWKLRVGDGTTPIRTGFGIYDPGSGSTAIYAASNGNVSLGTDVIYNESRLYVNGGGSGANVDVRGLAVDTKDQATIELEGSDYDVTTHSIFMQYNGVSTTGTFMGFPKADMARLVLRGLTNLIYTEPALPLIFGTNSAERLRISATGNVGIGTTGPNAKTDILATTEQLRLSYDASNYTSFTTSSSGILTIAPVGGQVTIAGQLSASALTAGGDGSNANIYIPTAVGAGGTLISQYQFAGSAAGTFLHTGFYGSSSTALPSGVNYTNVIVASAPVTTFTSGTHPWLANTVINSIGTVTNLGATITNTATLYVDGSSGAGTNNYSVYSVSGNNYFGGKVGIGVAIPSSLLTVGSSATASGIIAHFETSAAHCDLDPTTTGGLTCSSDMNLKKNIISLADSSPWSFNANVTTDNQSILEKVLALQPVQYNWNSEANGTSLHDGFIAQDVQQLFPELVTTDSKGSEALNYTGLIPYTVAAIKEMNLNIANIEDLTKSNSWRDALIAWLGSATNGIKSLVVQDKICVDDQCLNKTDIHNLLQLESRSSSSGTGGTVTASATPAPTGDIPPAGTQSPAVQSPEVAPVTAQTPAAPEPVVNTGVSGDN